MSSRPSWKPAEIGLFSPLFCLFRPFPDGLKSSWEIQKTEEKGLFPQISSDFLKPLQATLSFLGFGGGPSWFPGICHTLYLFHSRAYLYGDPGHPRPVSIQAQRARGEASKCREAQIRGRKRGHYERGLFAGEISGISKISKFSRKSLENGRNLLSFPESGGSLETLESLNSPESLENGLFWKDSFSKRPLFPNPKFLPLDCPHRGGNSERGKQDLSSVGGGEAFWEAF